MHSRLRRRAFLKTAVAVVPFVTITPPFSFARQASAASHTQPRQRSHELEADLVIIGGGLGGCAAALAAARNGLRVIMTEETDWVGGQLTAQAVPPDENPWIETFGGTRSYLELRRRIRDYYYRNYPLTAEARARPHLNPGNGWVSRLCTEPRVALAVLHEILAPYVSARQILILERHQAQRAQTNGDRVESILVRNLETGDELVLNAPL